MREADFEVLLRLVARLGGEQRAALGRAPASAAGGAGGLRGVAVGGARGGTADRGSVRRGAALPALRRREVAALGVRQRAAPLPRTAALSTVDHLGLELSGGDPPERAKRALPQVRRLSAACRGEFAMSRGPRAG